MLRFLPLMMMAALAGCSEKESAKLERELEILERTSASADDICSKKQEIAAAYLREESAGSYERAKSSADIACLRDTINRL